MYLISQLPLIPDQAKLVAMVHHATINIVKEAVEYLNHGHVSIVSELA